MDPWIRIGKKRIRIRIQLLVNDFCEFYFPCYFFPSLYFLFFLEVIIYYKSNKNTYFMFSSSGLGELASSQPPQLYDLRDPLSNVDEVPCASYGKKRWQ